MSPKRLGMKIKRLREARELTQEALGRKSASRAFTLPTSRAPTAVHHRTPSLGLLDRLAKALGVPVTELLE